MRVGLKQLKNYSEKFIRYEIGLKITNNCLIEERFYLMNEYYNKKSILKYLKGVSEVCMQNCEFESYDNLTGIIREIATDNTMYDWDIINLIRCCDCKFCRTSIDECGNHIPHCSKSFGNMKVDLMDYCSYGKRKVYDND